MHFFMSELNLGDPEILLNENRPFLSADEMTAAIIANCRMRLTEKDDLWIVGNFVRGDDVAVAERFLQEAPGQKHLIIGNHDHITVQELPGWTTVAPMIEMTADGQAITLCHYPLMTWNGAGQGADSTPGERLSIQIFGHGHGQTEGWWRCVNVSAKMWEYRPASVEEIITRSEDNFFAVPMHEAQFPARKPIVGCSNCNGLIDLRRTPGGYAFSSDGVMRTKSGKGEPILRRITEEAFLGTKVGAAICEDCVESFTHYVLVEGTDYEKIDVSIGE